MGIPLFCSPHSPILEVLASMSQIIFIILSCQHLQKLQMTLKTLWFEIQNVDQPNLVCGIIYRHPNGDMNNFFEYLSETVEKINNSNKLYTIMGDFNLDLFQIQSHTETDDFMNILGSSFFQPQILQPTRITDHSVTLIDNIFLNSLEHFTINGNKIYDI